MHTRWTLGLILALMLLGLAAVPVASAEPVCPAGFHPHTEGDMHSPGHMHVGLSMEAVDANDNGVVCVKHVTPDGRIHVHVDDFIP